MSHPDGVCCPHCGGGHTVIKTVPAGGRTRRRRLCGDCGKRFWTIEKVAGAGESCKIEKSIVAQGIRQLVEELDLRGQI